MRCFRASVLLVVIATCSQPTLHAATRTRHLTPTPVVMRHANDAVRHLPFTQPYLPAEAVSSAVNPPAVSHGFSLAAFTVHSILGLFGRPAQ